MPDSEIRPADETELAAAVAAARADRTPLEIRGGGSRSALGRPVQAAHALSVINLRGITDYRPGELSLTARAGTPMDEIEAALAEAEQMLAFEPPDPRILYCTDAATPTLGGLVATGMSGPRQVVSGSCRSSLTGCRFVSGRGESVRTGGRVRKNVTGYALERLLCGSLGTLGVLTEISLRTVPRPETEATLALPGLNAEGSVAAMTVALGLPHGVSGAAREASDADGVTLLRVEGFADSVAVRVAALQAVLADAGEQSVLAAEESAARWRQLRDLAGVAEGAGAIWRVVLRPSRAPSFLQAVAEHARSWQLDLGGAAVWMRTEDRGDAGAGTIRAAAAAVGGSATLCRAQPQTRLATGAFAPQPEPVARITAGLRARFDPAGILNPGRRGG